MNEIAKLIMGARSIPEAEKFVPSAKADVVNVTKEDLAFDYFVFFTTYPGCGVTCHPIFIKLNALNDTQKYGNKKIQILNCPYEIQPAYPDAASGLSPAVRERPACRHR